MQASIRHVTANNLKNHFIFRPIRARIKPSTLGLSDWSKTIVYCDGKLVLKSFKDHWSYAEFKEKINLHHTLRIKKPYFPESLFTCCHNDCSVKAIVHNFYEFTGVINSLGVKEKFEEFVNHEPEVSDLQAFSLVLLNISRRLTTVVDP